MEGAGRVSDDAPGGAGTLFLLSFRHRDELAAIVERAGWRMIAARRVQDVERRFVASGAAIAVIDARGAFDEGVAAVQALADVVQTNAGALLVLVSRGDVARLDAVHAAGATHYLASPFGEAELCQMLRFAARHAERLNGDARVRTRPAMEWRWRPEGAVVLLSPALRERMAASAEAIPLRGALRRLGRVGRTAARDAIARLRATGMATAFAHDDPQAERAAHHVRIEDGAIVGRVEASAIEPRQGMAGMRDALTGVGDRAAAHAWIARALESSVLRGEACVLLLLSASRFETINAAFGRGLGDAMLQGVARRIERALSGEPAWRQRLVARVAGTEFAVAIAPPATLEMGALLARRLADAMARPFVAGDHVMRLAVRIGVAGAAAGDDAASLMRRASAALAEASETDPIHLLDADAELRGEQDSMLEIDLRRALDRDEIDILYQPQVTVTGGRIVGVEALARWRHPELGELGAETLFAAAARSDYLVQLSDHVQRKAVRLAAAWPEALAGLRVAVNVTAADLARPGFATHFTALVDDSGLARGRVTVEITESGLIEDLAAAGTMLAGFRAAGFRVAIDDFGTGYSSLAYLKALPLDYLKIDKRLAEDITGSARDRVVVRGVIEMARSLGLSVIAEGVETEAQLELLAAEGCNLFQGFLCAPPLTCEALAALVAGT